tara:strand:- start:37 stop:603 length:567 start_codon:yes stop_codon:yes gene_type:complete
MKLRRNRKWIFSKERTPVIYLRIKGGEVFYIGETEDLRQGRPFRNGDSYAETEQSNKIYELAGNLQHKKELKLEKDVDFYKGYIGDYDYVICLKAPKNKKRREYWEAYLIVKHKPLMMNIKHYTRRFKGFNAPTQKETEEHQAKAVDRFTQYSNNNLRKNIKRHMLKGLTMYVNGNHCLKIISRDKQA